MLLFKRWLPVTTKRFNYNFN